MGVAGKRLALVTVENDRIYLARAVIFVYPVELPRLIARAIISMTNSYKVNRPHLLL